MSGEAQEKSRADCDFYDSCYDCDAIDCDACEVRGYLDKITELTASVGLLLDKNARLRAELEAMTIKRDEALADYGTAVTMLTERTMELEAAKRDLRQAGWGNLCEICAHNSEGDDPPACLMCDGEPGHSGFEWRGPCAENGGAE